MPLYMTISTLVSWLLVGENIEHGVDNGLQFSTSIFYKIKEIYLDWEYKSILVTNYLYSKKVMSMS